MKKIFIILVVFALICLCMFGLVACNEDGDDKSVLNTIEDNKLIFNGENEGGTIDYFKDNTYNVVTYKTKDMYVYKPQDVKCKYGIVFYLGTSITADRYKRIGNALAAQGYLVCVPSNLFAYNIYDTTIAQTAIIEQKYPDVKFFIGGHSQGGGAAVKIIKENHAKYLGAVLYSPMCYIVDSIATIDVKTILFWAENDNVLSDTYKQTAKDCTNPNTTIYVNIKGGNHMGYTSMAMGSMDGKCTIGKTAQQDLAIKKTLEMMNKIVRCL